MCIGDTHILYHRSSAIVSVRSKSASEVYRDLHVGENNQEVLFGFDEIASFVIIMVYICVCVCDALLKNTISQKLMLGLIFYVSY